MANPPPPYSDITGISRTVMKDNAQETLVNYDGNARPGEIVADLTTDPPALYVGNNAGQLTAITSGGGASLPLANGSSNINIATANGNITITAAGTNTWTFSTTGNLIAPGNITVGANDGRFIQDCADGTTSMRWINVVEESSSTQLIRVYTGDPAEENEIERAQIKLNWQGANQSGLTIKSFDDGASNSYDWEFQGDGTLAAPGNISTDGNITAGNVGVSERVTCQTVVTDPVNLGSLTPVFGARAFILDANLAAAGNFGANVSDGGSNAVPVWSDGTNWYIG